MFHRGADFHVSPYWVFTNPAIENYMQIAVGQAWDTYTVGMRLEAFMVAGGSTRGKNLSSKNQVQFLKAAIRSNINKSLSMSFYHVFKNVSLIALLQLMQLIIQMQ